MKQNLVRCALLLAPAVIFAAGPLQLLAQVAEPATQPAATVDPFAAPKPARAPTTQISLNFKDAPIDAVLDQLSSMAGFVVVKDTPLTGRVTVLSKQPVSPEEAVSLLNAVLKTNGYTAIQAGRILTITTRDKAKKANVPVFFGDDPKQIALTDTLITQVIPLKSVDAVKLKKDLEPLIGTDADVTSNAASNTLIITDTSINVFRIVNIVSALDKRDATENTILVKQLQYADATAAAKLVTDIFKTDESNASNNAQGPGAFFRQFGGGGRGGPGGGAAPADDNDKGRTGKIVASADARTNTVVVTGPAEILKVVEDMLKQLDANPAAEQAFFLYPLKNGQSANMASVLNSLFNGSSSSNNTNRNNTNGTTNNRSNGSTGGRGNSSLGGGSSSRSGTSSRGGTSSNSSSSNNTFGAAAINRGFNGGTTGVSSAVANAASQLTGQVSVVADTDTNSLLVSTASKYRDQVKQIIEQLDRPVPQVLIKVLIAEVTHDNAADFGVDFSVLNTRASGNGQSIGTTFGAPATGLVVSVLETNVTATLHALATAGKLDVLSRPYILASDNQEATITVGQTVPIITDSRLDTNNNPVNTITYKDIGIILDVTPHINPDGMVIMDVAPQVSSISDQTVALSSTVNGTVFNLRSADSRVGIKDGETIVIGGMMQDQKTESVSKVPLLGDIPLIGLMFSRHNVVKTKTELLFFLTPHVAKAPDNLKAMSDDERKGLKLTPDAVQPGMYDEHIRGLQRGAAEPSTQPSTPGVIEVPSKNSRLTEPPAPGTPEQPSGILGK